MSLRALLWDVDGTLVDSEWLHREAFNAAFTAAGLGWHWDAATYRQLLHVAGGRARLQSYAESHDPGFPAHVDREAALAAIHAWKRRRYRERVAAGALHLRPGVARLLAEARVAGLRLAIVTAAGSSGVDELLAGTLGPGARDAFAAVVTGDRPLATKPAPDLYLAALDELGIPARDAFAIEDSGNGCRAAVAAGITTLVTCNDDTVDQAFPGAVAVTDGLGEPGAPCRCLQGALDGASYVDLSLLMSWHAAAGCR